MKVLFVVNNFYIKGNGLSASAQRTVSHLRSRGLEVEVLSAKNPVEGEEEPKFSLENLKIPVFDKLVRSQGYIFAKEDEMTIEKAVKWADIIHLEEPFFLQMKVAKVARRLNKPCVGTYHLHPENLYASINMEKNFVLNDSTMLMWRNTVFNKCVIVQCPTYNVKERLLRWKFKARLKVITNGLAREALSSKKEVKEEKLSDSKYTVITIGRHSKEKDPITLLRSMKYSKYNKDIQLLFLGRGPKTGELEKYANKLVEKGIIKYPPIFKFCTLDELQAITAASDLYIHLAYIEVEGLSCLEAIQMGVVPIIAKYKYSATSQFALNEMSKFKARNAKDLASKIDYWLSDDERRKKEAKKYRIYNKEYDIEKSIDEIISMYQEALDIYYKRK